MHNLRTVTCMVIARPNTYATLHNFNICIHAYCTSTAPQQNLLDFTTFIRQFTTIFYRGTFFTSLINRHFQTKSHLNVNLHLAFRLSKELPIGKCFCKPIKATMMEVKNFVLTFATGYYQLTICASIITIKDS